MSSAPWTCSQCGTVNEPAATSCRGCGRWPSLFDLQESAVDTPPADEAPEREVPRYEPPDLATETAGDGGAAVPASPPELASPVPEQSGPPPSPRGRTRRPAQRLVRLIIPIAALLYFLISSHFSSH